MKRSVASVALVVRDYDEAIAYYARVLGFEVLEDAPAGGKRWVVVGPPGGEGCRLVLAQAANDEQRACVGRQAGGRVFLFLETDDFARDHERMRGLGVKFREAPRPEPYGTVAVFEDLYGNPWDLIQPARAGGDSR
jgi:catechol 2,3-dioxygenase-like lactoylglutathione lyase family enzyme